MKDIKPYQWLVLFYLHMNTEIQLSQIVVFFSSTHSNAHNRLHVVFNFGQDSINSKAHTHCCMCTTNIHVHRLTGGGLAWNGRAETLHTLLYSCVEQAKCLHIIIPDQRLESFNCERIMQIACCIRSFEKKSSLLANTGHTRSTAISLSLVLVVWQKWSKHIWIGERKRRKNCIQYWLPLFPFFLVAIAVVAHWEPSFVDPPDSDDNNNDDGDDCQHHVLELPFFRAQPEIQFIDGNHNKRSKELRWGLVAVSEWD